MYFNFLSEINMFNKLLIFVCAESAVKHQTTYDYYI